MGILPHKKEVEADEAQSPTPPEYNNVATQGVGAAAPEELEGLTLFEKKCVLINKEIDANGFGKYQWYIWILCGLGYFIDLIWAQAFGLILSPLQQELGFPGLLPWRFHFSVALQGSRATMLSRGSCKRTGEWCRSHLRLRLAC